MYVIDVILEGKFKRIVNFGSNVSYKLFDDILVVFRLVPNDL